ncbi:HD-GYP domain-containing protein [Brevibacillus sp. NPDC058079]|uniref:HD-GYP domain-containing protein n=1 Tax=Brevibacillus sp. NPDC058079 TaxID=3346330 RepID=UPI0036E54E17
MENIESLLGRYPEVYEHTLRVMELATGFAYYLGYSAREVSIIRTGSLLHDIGKLFVPKNILFKVEQLTKEDFEVIKKHTNWGYEFLMTGLLPETENALTDEDLDVFIMHVQKGYQFLKEEYPSLSEEMLSIVIQHHERIDGMGYPYGISGDQIHPYAKLVACCDVYDAITSKRCYKPSMTEEYALACIQEGLGTQFDEVLGQEFLQFIREVWKTDDNGSNYFIIA